MSIELELSDKVAVVTGAGGFSSSIRGCFAGGSSPSAINTISYVTIQTEGDAIDFGDMGSETQSRGCSNAHGGL